MGDPVIHFEVVGKDADRLKGFYGDLFGWQYQDVGGPMQYAIVDREGNTTADGVGISGGIGGAPDYGGHLTFYVNVADIEATLAKVESLGGSRVMGPEPVPGMNILIAHFKDPEGNLVGAQQDL